MSTHDDEHVPGQLDLAGDLPELDAESARLAAELDRVTALRTEHRLRALNVVTTAAAAATTAGERLDQAVKDARAAGATWQQIADAAGIADRQTAWKRWGARP